MSIVCVCWTKNLLLLLLLSVKTRFPLLVAIRIRLC